jgi:hypothetical protein
MATRTEYQVVDSEDAGNEVRTYKTLKEAKADYNKNKNAVELRKVVWTISKDDTWKGDNMAVNKNLFKGTKWLCSVGKCKDKPRVFSNPEDCYRHMKKAHKC